MSDSANGTATGLKPGTIQPDSALTVSCTTGQADDTTLTLAGSWTPRPPALFACSRSRSRRRYTTWVTGPAAAPPGR